MRTVHTMGFQEQEKGRGDRAISEYKIETAQKSDVYKQNKTAFDINK